MVVTRQKILTHSVSCKFLVLFQEVMIMVHEQYSITKKFIQHTNYMNKGHLQHS